MKDLLGEEIKPEMRRRIAPYSENPMSKRRATPANGYAYEPGTGPAGEFCRTCKHAASVPGGRRNYWKCKLVDRGWTHGPGSDIRLKSPACKGWAKK